MKYVTTPHEMVKVIWSHEFSHYLFDTNYSIKELYNSRLSNRSKKDKAFLEDRIKFKTKLYKMEIDNLPSHLDFENPDHAKEYEAYLKSTFRYKDTYLGREAPKNVTGRPLSIPYEEFLPIPLR